MHFNCAFEAGSGIMFNNIFIILVISIYFLIEFIWQQSTNFKLLQEFWKSPVK